MCVCQRNAKKKNVNYEQVHHTILHINKPYIAESDLEIDIKLEIIYRKGVLNNIPITYNNYIACMFQYDTLFRLANINLPSF